MFARKNFGRASQVGAFLVAGLIALWTTESAMASEIVDLRIGSHPEFTRIVFELDRPTGYRIERASPSPGVSELVVSIDATSIPRKVQNKDALIGLVTITPRGKGSSAEIRLAREGLRLKEMILSSPPRIVLDILASPVAKKASSASAGYGQEKGREEEAGGQARCQTQEPIKAPTHSYGVGTRAEGQNAADSEKTGGRTDGAVRKAHSGCEIGEAATGEDG